MSAFHFKELATQPALGDSIELREPGTATPITGQITDVSGGNLSNPFLVSAAGVEGDWAFVAPDDVPYDVYWVEDANVIGKSQEALADKVDSVGGNLEDYTETRHAVTTSGNVSIDLADGNVQRFILDAARTITMPPDPGDLSQSFVLIIESATFATTWGGSPVIEWLTSDGAAPTLVTAANLVNVVTFIWDDTDTRWLGFLGGTETA